MDLTEYEAQLRALTVGDGGEAQLDGLTPRALKRRLGQAAKRLGLALKWARDNTADAVVFQVKEARQPGRRGRRRKAE